jgi:small subunit ribosomal protein S17
VADENTSEEIQDEAPVEPATEPEAETTDAPEGVADVENVPEEAAPEESEAAPEPEASVEPESTEEPAEGPPDTSADAEVSREEPAAESSDDAAEGQPTADESDDLGTSAAAEVPSKKKRKRLPRSLRRRRTKPARERPAERKPIARLPKPEHERGRRQERQGTVVSAGADKTIVVRVDVVKVHPMYKKVVKRSTKLHAHDEENEAKVGDIVRLVETRPLSKLKRWRLQEVVEAAK